MTHPRTVKPIYPLFDEPPVFKQLRQEAQTTVRQLEPQRKSTIVLKALLFPLLYILFYAAALRWGNNPPVLYGCYFLLGVVLVCLFLNVIHDAVHGTIFKSKGANRLLVHSFDLMGANSFIWQVRHVRFHHNYPNVQGWDTDIEQSKIFRVFPHSEVSPFHRYQHLYLPLLYPFYLANWLLVRDFKDFFDPRSTVRKLVRIPTVEYIRLLVFKAFFLFYMIVLPVWVLAISWAEALTAFAIFLFTASIFSLSVLLSPHANTESSFPLPDSQNRLPHPWLMHMLLTTNDVKGDNFFTRFFMGCFNYHVAHHLFPNINHVYYPEITARLKELARKYGLPYREYPLATSLKNHYRLLKQNRIQENLFEETM